MQPANEVLVSHCDPAKLENVSTLLTEAGYKVEKLRNGADVCVELERKTYVAVILSLKLQGMSATNAAKAAAHSKHNGKTPIFIFSSSIDPASANLCKALPSVQFLPEEFTAATVVEKLDSVRPKQSLKAYDVRILNAFSESVHDVVKHYLGDEPRFGKPQAKQPGKTLGEYSSLISIAGEGIKGSIALCFETNFLIAFGTKMLKPVKTIFSDDDLADLAGEVCNQVCGSLKLKLARLGLRSLVGLPQVVHGANHSIAHLVKSPVIVIPMAYQEKKCLVEFCMVKSDERSIDPGKAGKDDAKGGDILLF